MTRLYILGHTQSLQFALLQVGYLEPNSWERVSEEGLKHTGCLGLWDLSPFLLLELPHFW